MGADGVGAEVRCGRRARAALVTALLLAPTACTDSAPEPSPGSPTAEPGPVADLAVEVLQPRSSVAAGGMVLRVVATGTTPLLVGGASLTGGPLVDAARWEPDDGPRRVRPGRALQLDLGSPTTGCPGASAGPVLVHLDVGEEGSDDVVAVELVPGDPHDLLARTAADVCRAEEVAAVAAVRLDAVEPPEVADGPAVLVVRLEPQRGGRGTLDVRAVGSTPLVSPVGPDGRPATGAPVGARVTTGDEPLVLRVAVVPTRCDAHALAEDKVGTLVPLEVAVDDGPAGRLLVPVAPEVAADLVGWVARRCGIAG